MRDFLVRLLSNCPMSLPSIISLRKVIRDGCLGFIFAIILGNMGSMIVIYLAMNTWLREMLNCRLVRLTYLHWMLTLKVKLPIILGFNLGSLIIILKSGILHM